MWLQTMQPHATYIHLFSFWIWIWIWPNFRVSPFHRRGTTVLGSWTIKRIFNQPQRPRRQERQTFTYLTMKNCSCARIARAGFISVHFGPALVLPTTWNHLFCSCVEDVSIRRQIFTFLFSPLSGSYQFNSRIISKHFAIQRTWNNRGMITETRSFIFRSRCRRCHPCFGFLMSRILWRAGIRTFRRAARIN